MHSLFARILLVAGALIFPIATLAYMQASALHRAMAVIQAERDGVACLRRSYAILGDAEAVLATAESRHLYR